MSDATSPAVAPNGQLTSASPAAAAAAAGTPAPRADPNVIKLRRPITTHEGDKREIVIREPVASDFIALNKLPVTLRQTETGVEADVNFALAAKWLSRLTGVDEILLGQMHHQDWLAAVRRLNTMLNEDEPGN